MPEPPSQLEFSVTLTYGAACLTLPRWLTPRELGFMKQWLTMLAGHVPECVTVTDPPDAPAVVLPGVTPAAVPPTGGGR